MPHSMPVVSSSSSRTSDTIQVCPSRSWAPGRTSAGFAVAAWRTGAPLLGMTQHRDASGVHRVELHRLPLQVPEARSDAVPQLTAASQDFYARAISARPWTWWWLHDRWRPVG